MARVKITLSERFWTKVQRTETCWLWIRYRNKDGYGRFMFEGRVWNAHRISYRLHYGDIPQGQEVMHVCDNPPCVNPAHLKTGTHRENIRDMLEKKRGRSPVGTQSPNAKITPEAVRQIRTLSKQGVHQKLIAKRFGITQSTVSKVVLRLAWRHVA